MKRWPSIVVIIVSVIWTAWFSWFTVMRHAKTNSSRFDLGNVEQTVWNTVHGRFFSMTDPYGQSQVSRLTFHGDLFLVTLVPFYAAVPRTETLILLQVLAVASGGWALFLLARRVWSPWWGALFAGVYYLLPTLQWATIFDVHAVTFATPLILWAVYAAVCRKYWLMATMIILAMTTKEEIGLSLILIGIFVWRWQKQRRWGMAAIGIPLLWSLAMLLIILPSTRADTANTSPVYSSPFGNSAARIVLSAVEHPFSFGRALTGTIAQRYFWQVGGEYGFLFLLNPWSLGALPDTVINIISAKPAQHLIISHYTGGMTPWLLVGTMYGAWWLWRRLQKVQWMSVRPRIISTSIVGWLVLWGGYAAYAFGPFPGARNDWTRFATWKNVYAAPVKTWEKTIPSSAAVSVTNNIGSHFARRERLYSFPIGTELSDYAVVLEGHATPEVATQAEVTAKVVELKSNPNWQVVFRNGDMTVLKNLHPLKDAKTL